MKQQENLQITPEMAAHDEAAHACKRVWPSHSKREHWAKINEKNTAWRLRRRNVVVVVSLKIRFS